MNQKDNIMKYIAFEGVWGGGGQTVQNVSKRTAYLLT